MTITYPSPIFGPICSRRLGTSLGINLLPEDGKICTFDCIYCECGLNHDHIPTRKMPTRQEVCLALEFQLIRMKDEGQAPDVITFAGNGEPTLHPHFPEIIDDTIALRNRYFPCAKISVLTNSTQIDRPSVFEALLKVDNNICKLDTVNAEYINLIDRPNYTYNLSTIIDRLQEFGTRCIIQTMFMRGQYEGKSVTNTTDTFIRPWLEALSAISPREVMIYTIDRETPVKGIYKILPEELDAIALQVRQIGLTCRVAY